MRPRYIASACLAGLPCRYDGKSKPHPLVQKLYAAGQVWPVCPEHLSGLPVPRPPAEAVQGRILLQTGQDVTEAFHQGAARALKSALASGCRKAILKARSPSCGVGEIYDGTFSGRTRSGDGVFTALLRQEGFEVQTEEDLEKARHPSCATPVRD